MIPISTYTLHHLTDEEKAAFIKVLLPLLKEDGFLFIGDIAFQTRGGLEQCRMEHIERWDEDEFCL